ncbi:hypothetical protein EC991_007427 [Linnemannia zychae]|nr:hypothetical protein EC991_007427 [Linnemannia zychae]
MNGPKYPLAQRVSSFRVLSLFFTTSLLLAFCLISSQDNIHVQAVSHSSGSTSNINNGSGSNTGGSTVSTSDDKPSGTFYKDEPFDDTYPEPLNATATAVTPVVTTPYRSTKTWPALPVATDTGDDSTVPAGDDGSFPDQEYVRLLDATLLFYEAQRSGRLPSDQRVKWRNDSALFDGKDAGIDLTGGYYDAGDYLKFIFPLTFSLTEICYGAIEFYEGYTLADKSHHLDQTVRWGLDWLIKAHPNNNTLYVQVGVSEVDNNYWGPDTGIPTPRPSFFVSNLKPGTDVMADAAVAFLSCSVLYREKLHDSEYADTLQRHGESLFTLAETALPQQTYQTVVPAASCCYASTGFLDELAWAAAWMYRLTKDPIYATKASRYVAEYSKLEHGSIMLPVTWDDKTGLVYILMAGLTRGTAEGVQWQALAEKFGNFIVHAPKPCAFTSGGMYYCYGYSGDDTSVVAANAAFAMALLSNNMDTWLMNNHNSKSMTNALENEIRGKIEAYRAFAVRQVEYLLGDNPEKTPYVVGVHPNSPTNPHSSLASGGRSTDSIDTEPVKEAHVLMGALVGGPDRNDRFQDLRSNWRQNEVALDYNAPFTSLMAYQVMTSHDPPPYATIAAGRPAHGVLVADMPVWKLVLIIALITSILFLIAIYIFYFRRHDIQLWYAEKFRKGPKNQFNNGKQGKGHEALSDTDTGISGVNFNRRPSASSLATITFEEKRQMSSSNTQSLPSVKIDESDNDIEKQTRTRNSLPLGTTIAITTNRDGQKTQEKGSFFSRAKAALRPPPLLTGSKESNAASNSGANGKPYDLESSPGSASSSGLLLARQSAASIPNSMSPLTPTPSTPMTPSGGTVLQPA